MSRDAPSQDTLHAGILDRISDGVLAVDNDLRFTYLNERAAQLLDADRDGLLGRPVWDPLTDDAAAVFRPPLEQAVETGVEQSCEWVVPERRLSWLVRFYPDDDGLTIVVTETTDQRRHEETLGRLHEATRRMLLATSPEQVADLVSRAAVEILELPINAVHYYDEATDSLSPVAQSPACYDVLGEAPELDSGLAWDAYQSGAVGVYGDLQAETDVFDADTPFGSELFVPLAEYGVFIVAAEAVDEFTDTDVTLAKLLGANATVALDQVTSESRLARQRDNLELLTRMMSHDIRNDLQVVGAVAEMLDEHVDGSQQEYVEKIRRNTAAAVELTASAQELVEAMLRTETEPTPVALREILRDQVERVAETQTATVTVDGEIPNVGVLADEMLGSVFRNVLKNAVQHNRGADPTVTVSVESDETTVRVHVADNGPGVPDERKESIFGRGERGMSSQGTGIGLYLVQTLVDQYGGHVWVEDRAERSSASSRPEADDNEPDGAVFVIELRRE